MNEEPRDWRYVHYLGWVLLGIGLALSWLSIRDTGFDPTPIGIMIVDTRLLLIGQILVIAATLFFAKMFYQQSNLAAYFAEELYPDETVKYSKPRDEKG